MMCALTARTLKPGTFDEFRAAFLGDENADVAPEGWVRFNMLRSSERPDEVVTFGFFDGSLDELRSSASEHGYAEQMEKIAPFVESVGTDGLYEVVEDRSMPPLRR
ncbi:MAG: hypothetical protein QOH58_1278 [Thermoleophilaceae bacterium]|jgi:quinol monooxygenase YgiN|nr:hypothetical protein [Thermoleophilaceae bacterium]